MEGCWHGGLKASITHAPISWRKPPVKPENKANSFLAAQSQASHQITAGHSWDSMVSIAYLAGVTTSARIEEPHGREGILWPRSQGMEIEHDLSCRQRLSLLAIPLRSATSKS